MNLEESSFYLKVVENNEKNFAETNRATQKFVAALHDLMDCPKVYSKQIAKELRARADEDHWLEVHNKVLRAIATFIEEEA